MPSRLADLIRRARRLATERDRLIESLAADWTRALRGQRLSASDLDEKRVVRFIEAYRGIDHHQR